MSFTATCRKNKINMWAYLKTYYNELIYPISRLDKLLPNQWQEANLITLMIIFDI